MISTSRTERHRPNRQICSASVHNEPQGRIQRDQQHVRIRMTMHAETASRRQYALSNEKYICGEIVGCQNIGIRNAALTVAHGFLVGKQSSYRKLCAQSAFGVRPEENRRRSGRYESIDVVFIVGIPILVTLLLYAPRSCMKSGLFETMISMPE